MDRQHDPSPEEAAREDRVLERRVWEGILHPGDDDLLLSTFWGTEALNLDQYLNRKVRITIEVLDR